MENKFLLCQSQGVAVAHLLKEEHSFLLLMVSSRLPQSWMPLQPPTMLLTGIYISFGGGGKLSPPPPPPNFLAPPPLQDVRTLIPLSPPFLLDESLISMTSSFSYLKYCCDFGGWGGGGRGDTGSLMVKIHAPDLEPQDLSPISVRVFFSFSQCLGVHSALPHQMRCFTAFFRGNVKLSVQGYLA